VLTFLINNLIKSIKINLCIKKTDKLPYFDRYVTTKHCVLIYYKVETKTTAAEI